MEIGESMGIYDHDMRLQRAERVIQQTNCSEKNKILIFKFKNYLLVQGLAVSVIPRYLSELNIASGWLGKDFTDATEDG